MFPSPPGQNEVEGFTYLLAKFVLLPHGGDRRPRQILRHEMRVEEICYFPWLDKLSHMGSLPNHHKALDGVPRGSEDKICKDADLVPLVLAGCAFD